MQGLGCSFVEDLLGVKGFSQICCEDCSKVGLGPEAFGFRCVVGFGVLGSGLLGVGFKVYRVQGVFIF